MVANKAGAAGLGSAIVAFIVCCTIAVQSMIPGCKPIDPEIAKLPASQADLPVAAAEAPTAQPATLPVVEAAVPECRPYYADTEISNVEYGKIVDMVEEYPELAGKVTRAIWADFKVSRREYVAIYQEWQVLCQQTGRNKRRLLHVLIMADPTIWGSQEAGSVKAGIRGTEPAEADPTPVFATPPAEETP